MQKTDMGFNKRRISTRFTRKNKRIIVIVAAIFSMICILVAFLCFQYYIKLKSTVRDESKGYITELSKQMGSNVNKNIGDNFSALKTIALSLESANLETFADLADAVHEFQTIWNYEKIMVVNGSNISFDEHGNEVRIENTEYLTNVVSGRKPALSSSELIDGKDCIVFAVPLDISISKSRATTPSTKMLALAASYESSTFNQAMSMHAFDGKGSTYIIKKDGTRVVGSDSDSELDLGYNILNSLSLTTIFDNVSIEDVREDIAGGVNGFVEIKQNNKNYYLSYFSLDEQIGVHDWRMLTFVPVDEVNAKSTIMLNLTLMLCAFVTVSFAILFTCLMALTLKNKKKLENLAYTDSLTGGNTIQYFNESVTNKLKPSNRPQYAIIYTNIDRFKLLNEQFGKSNCDDLLCGLNHAFLTDLTEDECAGRLFADNFCLLLKYTSEKELLERTIKWKALYEEYAKEHNIPNLPFMIRFGVYPISNDTLPISHMIDRAKISLMESTSLVHENIKISVYDEEVRKTMIREKHLEDMMEDAILNNEFEVYLQPKYYTESETIGGAEALVRWVSRTEGMIFPDEFIPLFEKNSFIVKLDLFVFESVCKTLKSWIDSGLEPIKISVNCSRVNLKNQSFMDSYEQIADKYNIPKQFIEIEFTENVVFSDIEHFSSIINLVHSIGFGCSMDDFGSGFSSLSMIQDIPVDTLKLDKIFFHGRGQESKSRTESVVASIITMAKALSMTTVAEGVEQREHVDMLKKLGCDLVQGYYFAKPMPINQFEKLLYK